MSWELHGSDGHFEIQDMDGRRRVALVKFATLEDVRAMVASPLLLHAAEQALSDLVWIQEQGAGTNMQSSILLLRAAIGQAKGMLSK